MKLQTLLVLVCVGMVMASILAYAEDDDDREGGDEQEYEDDDQWDLSDDFVVISPPAEPIVQTPVVQPQNPIVQPVIRYNISAFQDDDNDTILNRDDKFPGKDDFMMIDSDGDGVVDRIDAFPGFYDEDYLDSDGDGIVDGLDSQPTVPNDKDFDGIDDSIDTHDDRPFLVRLFSFLGLL